MSTASVTGVTVLGALTGWLAVPLARHVLGVPPGGRVVGGADPGRGDAVPDAGTPLRADSRADERCGGSARAGVRPRRVGVVVAGAAVFGGLATQHGADPALPALLLIAAAGLVLAVTDLIALRLPDPLVGAVALGGGLGLLGTALATGEPRRAVTALAGAGLSLCGYLLLALLPGARLGFGDVKLAAALGLPLGWLGWPTLRLGLLLPHVLAGVAVLALLAAGRIRRDTPLPFGPAILAGAWLAAVLT